MAARPHRHHYRRGHCHRYRHGLMPLLSHPRPSILLNWRLIYEKEALASHHLRKLKNV
ncbi:hypothetical protein ISN45_Aa03g026220 [Arabidopsis thaliana x Arabidopsis arenosa]|uniref:Uncharacterized protein n=1 Tax=Arabidopsis thaliana x Arabidopsis arenosa TaxID=1240361 RepID=A0A8T2AW50_9BRAS|nr:hypothetical protein ISN45_Aa03g026220 [Arabidopsis thaliana x Arabidopsis arenosa]